MKLETAIRNEKLILEQIKSLDWGLENIDLIMKDDDNYDDTVRKPSKESLIKEWSDRKKILTRKLGLTRRLIREKREVQ